MSALGQKQTCAAQNAMSALPPEADISCRAPPSLAANYNTAGRCPKLSRGGPGLRAMTPAFVRS